MNSKEMKEQAEYIWNRLDDLYKSDTVAYKKFIDKQLEDYKIVSAPPEPRICLYTKTLEEESKYVFINVCVWKRLPYPENDQEPIKLMAGKYETRKSKGHFEIVIPVGLNDKLYEECTDTEVNRNRLFELILELIEENLKVKVHRQYKKYKEIFRGDLPADPRSIFLTRSQVSKENETDQIAAGFSVNSPEELIKRMSMMESQERANDEMSKLEKEIKIEGLFDDAKQKDKKKENLIQDISCDAENQQTASGESHKNLPTPEHELEKISADDEHPNRYVLKIQLPSVSGVRECDLSITEVSVELIVKEKYYFAIHLDSCISEDESIAKFSKKSKNLTLTLPIK